MPLHEMTFYLTLLGLLDTAYTIPHVSCSITAAATKWRAQEAPGRPQTTWAAFTASFLETCQTLDTERIVMSHRESLGQRTSVTDYVDQTSGFLVEPPHMHPANTI